MTDPEMYNPWGVVICLAALALTIAFLIAAYKYAPSIDAILSRF